MLKDKVVNQNLRILFLLIVLHIVVIVIIYGGYRLSDNLESSMLIQIGLLFLYFGVLSVTSGDYAKIIDEQFWMNDKIETEVVNYIFRTSDEGDLAR